MAAAVQDQRDKPFWLVLAQSWLRLAEHAAARDDEDEPRYQLPPASRSAH